MSGSWISFFPESTITNSQELVWKATGRGGGVGGERKGIKTTLICRTAKFVLICVGELLGVSCSLSLLTLPTELQPFLLSGDKSIIITVCVRMQGCHIRRDIAHVNATSSYSPPFHFSLHYQSDEDLTKPSQK